MKRLNGIFSTEKKQEKAEKPKLVINGYGLHPKYTNITSFFNDMMHNVIIVHSDSDARGLLRLFRYLGVNNLRYANESEKQGNFPQNGKRGFAYQLAIDGDGPMVLAYVLCNSFYKQSPPMMDIDNVIVSKSWLTWLKDM